MYKRPDNPQKPKKNYSWWPHVGGRDEWISLSVNFFHFVWQGVDEFVWKSVAQFKRPWGIVQDWVQTRGTICVRIKCEAVNEGRRNYMRKHETLLERIEEQSSVWVQVCLWPRCLVGRVLWWDVSFGMLFTVDNMGYLAQARSLNSLTSDI